MHLRLFNPSFNEITIFNIFLATVATKLLHAIQALAIKKSKESRSVRTLSKTSRRGFNMHNNSYLTINYKKEEK
jgi:hypothetical protein